MLFKLLGFYLIIGVLIWAAQLASDVYDRTMTSQPTCAEGDAPTVTQVPGVDGSGLLQIGLWGPSLIQTWRHGMALSEIVRPTECTTKGSIKIGSTRCECQAPLIVQGTVRQFHTVRYWAKPDVACEASKPPACNP